MHLILNSLSTLKFSFSTSSDLEWFTETNFWFLLGISFLLSPTNSSSPYNREHAFILWRFCCWWWWARLCDAAGRKILGLLSFVKLSASTFWIFNSIGYEFSFLLSLSRHIFLSNGMERIKNIIHGYINIRKKRFHHSVFAGCLIVYAECEAINGIFFLETTFLLDIEK